MTLYIIVFLQLCTLLYVATLYIVVFLTLLQKWDAKAHRDLADDLYYGGGEEFSFRNPVWKNDVGHGAWDDEKPGPDKKNLANHKGSTRKVALELVGIIDSPNGLALDRCELVNLTPEMRDQFGEILERRRVRVKQWFPNNERQMIRGKGLKSVLKTGVEKKHAPQAQHVYLHELYASEIHEKAVAEAARMGKSANNIGLISQMTRAEWKKVTPEVRDEIIIIQSEQKKQFVAVKAHRYNEINLSAVQKQQAIESLGVEFDNMFRLYEALTGWAFLVIGAGIEPRSGHLQSCSWEYGTDLASGENFFKSFDRSVAIGLVLGGLAGDKRKADAYYGGPLLAHMQNVERVKAQQQEPEESIASSSSMDVDVVTRDVPKVAGNDNSNFNLPPVNEPLPDEPPQGKSSSDTVDKPLPDEPLPNEPLQGKSFADEPLPLLSPNQPPDFPFPSGSDMDIDLLLAAWNSGQLSMPSPNSMHYQSSQNRFQNGALFFQSPQQSPVYDNTALLQLPQGNLFPITDDFQPNIPAPSSSNDIWSCSFSWNSYDYISPGPSLPNQNYYSPQTESSMSSTAFPLSSSTSSVVPSSFPSATMLSEDVVMSEIETISDLATTNELREPTKSHRASAEVCPRSLSNRSVPVIPRRARNRKPPGPREVKTLVGSEQSTPIWQPQSLASMQDPTFGNDWANMLVKWYSLETILSKEKYTVPKNRPRVLAIWLDGVRSFSDLLSINDIDQFGHSMVTWWNSIQPTWRQSIEGLLLPKYNKLFACLCKGGQNGIVTVIFGLFWWRKNSDGSSQWHALVTDSGLGYVHVARVRAVGEHGVVVAFKASLGWRRGAGRGRGAWSSSGERDGAATRDNPQREANQVGVGGGFTAVIAVGHDDQKARRGRANRYTHADKAINGFANCTDSVSTVMYKVYRPRINSSNNIDVILECLAPHHSRLRTLELNVCPPGFKALTGLAVANLPKLTALRLSIEGLDISGLMGGSDGLEQAVLVSLYHALDRHVEAFRHADALRDVHLYGIDFSYIRMPLRQLTRFAGDILDLDDYLLLFKDALELVEADLRMLCPQDLAHPSIPDKGPLWHTRLSRLSLYADIPGLKFIRLPALQYLRIEETRDTKDETFTYDVGADIQVFLRESQSCATTLSTLSLRVDLVGARDIYDALTFDGVTCLAPNVEDLSLRDDSSFFSETDGIDWSFHASFLRRFLVQNWCSRGCGPSRDRGDGRLRTLSLCAPYSSRPTETLEKLAELQREGLFVEFHGYSRVARWRTGQFT
ncbi:hypothetical protein EV421DRAFT_1739478 [Armillaria borealis]|uniref:Uncharacterized protein n=1 Tax=Armillaria borealis TaxID=47425 RepID=A0AA39MK01_9AGAR|nr:hypothetical protein EV421DRAFT_1739478 [Armillaria borealis]